jgi:aminopeptidase N
VRRALVAATAAAALILAGTAAPAQGARHRAAPVPGAPGVGDTYFPDYGNGGYDVSHYDVRLRYYPETDRLTGTTTILAKATADLSAFNLDFLLDVSSVRVNGRVAAFARQGDHELVVTPERALTRGQQVTVVVQYAGIPSTKVGAGYIAWTRTPDGALAVGQPEIAWWWFPSNDHPSDKATFDISVSVPNGVEVISNGVMPRNPAPEIAGWTRWSWRSTKPMATYLAFMAIGQYDIVTDTAPNGQPVINAYSALLSQDFADAARASVERTAEVVDWESGVFGPYPFEAQGGVVAPPDVLGFALENQTRPVYASAFFRRGSNMSVIVHENAHQWFGDSIAVAQWDDIWLNEGFASYAEWMWSEAQGEGTAQEIFDFVYNGHPADDPFWTVKPGDPGAPAIFDDAVYDRGAMTLHQLRLAVGDADFFAILKAWTAEQQYGNGDTAEFVALAERVSGEQLDDLFQTWLFTPERPELAGAAALRARTATPQAPKSWAQLRRTIELHRH